MHIAVTTDGNNISSHFEKAIKFTIFEILKGRTRGKVVIDVSESGGEEALTYILINEGVDVLLCGEIKEAARAEIEGQGIKVVPKLRGNVSTVLGAYTRGRIKEN